MEDKTKSRKGSCHYFLRKVIKDTSISMSGQPLKVTGSVKSLSVDNDNHLSMKLHVQHTERASLISKMRITILNSVIAILLILLFTIFIRPYIDNACTAVTAVNKKQRQNLEVIQNSYLQCERRAVDSTCISNNKLRSYC